jgi:hypothetical protein
MTRTSAMEGHRAAPPLIFCLSKRQSGKKAAASTLNRLDFGQIDVVVVLNCRIIPPTSAPSHSGG